MTFIIVIGIFVIAFFIWDLYNKHIMVGIQKDFDEMDAKDGVTYTEGVDYMGGFKDFGRADDCVIKVRKDGINFILNNYKYNEYDNKVVEYKSIKSVEIESETSIKERVSIGKLVFFVVFAFGMKGKESEITTDYLVITVDYEGKDCGLIVKSTNPYNLRREIMKELNSYQYN